jgi:hypothetical protein
MPPIRGRKRTRFMEDDSFPRPEEWSSSKLRRELRARCINFGDKVRKDVLLITFQSLVENYQVDIPHQSSQNNNNGSQSVPAYQANANRAESSVESSQNNSDGGLATNRPTLGRVESSVSYSQRTDSHRDNESASILGVVRDHTNTVHSLQTSLVSLNERVNTPTRQRELTSAAAGSPDQQSFTSPCMQHFYFRFHAGRGFHATYSVQ